MACPRASLLGGRGGGRGLRRCLTGTVCGSTVGGSGGLAATGLALPPGPLALGFLSGWGVTVSGGSVAVSGVSLGSLRLLGSGLAPPGPALRGSRSSCAMLAMRLHYSDNKTSAERVRGVCGVTRTELDFLHLLGGKGLLVANVALIQSVKRKGDGNGGDLAGVGHTVTVVSSPARNAAAARGARTSRGKTPPQ